MRVGERVVGATLAVARGQGLRIATTSVRAGLAMTGFLQGVRWDGGTHGSRPTIVFFVGQGPRALPWVRRLSGGGLRAARPTVCIQVVRWGHSGISAAVMAEGASSKRMGVPSRSAGKLKV